MEEKMKVDCKKEAMVLLRERRSSPRPE